MRRAILGPLLAIGAAGCSLAQPAFVSDGDRLGGGTPLPVAVEFEGVEWATAARLRQRIEDLMLDLSKAPSREAAVVDAGFEIVEALRDDGYAEAKVGHRVHPEDDRADAERIEVRFDVQLGPRVVLPLNRLHLVDAATGQPIDRDRRERLLALWSRRTTAILGFGQPIFVESALEAFATDIGHSLHAEGWLDATAELQIDRPTGAAVATATVGVRFGARCRFGTTSLDARIRAALTGGVPEAPRGEWTNTEYRDYLVAIRNALRKLGHARPELGVERRRRDGDLVDLVVSGDPGPIVTVSAIDPPDPDRTKTWVSRIRRELELEPGDRFDGNAVDTALDRLYRTGLFRRVTIDPVPSGEDRVRLVMGVDEIDSQTIDFLGGWGSWERMRGGIRYQERNLFGSGRQLTIDGRASQRGYRLYGALSDPDLLRTGVRLTISGEQFERERPSFTDQAIGTTVTLGRRFAGHGNARLGYTFRDHLGARSAAIDAGADDYVEGRAFFDVRLDTRDNPVLPQRGGAVIVGFDVVDDGLGASADFHRLRIDANWQIRLTRSTKLALRTAHGWIWPGGAVPIQERWFNGGEDTVRSFREDRIGPTDAAGRPIGGEARMLYSAELRQALGHGFELSLFGDAGNVQSRTSDYSFDDLRPAIGGGLRFLLPIGPLRVDAAYNPDRRPDEKEVVVHFSVGYPF